MCHMKFDNLERISIVQAMRDLPRIINPVNVICMNCQFGKQERSHYRSKEQSTFGLLDLIHTDLCVPTRVRIIQGER